MSTIAAIATPVAVGGLSVIRISGENSLEIADKIFKPVSSKKNPSEMEGYTCAYGKISDFSGEILDDVVLTVFRAPKSYTGEDVVEISCHGGIFITREVLKLVYSAGAKPAEAGEFTKRAFLSGKMNLLEVEAVMDIISAEGKSAVRAAASLREGNLFAAVTKVSDKILKLLGEIGVWVDYPEEDIADVDDVILLETLKECESELERLLETYDVGKIVREGIDTVIVGKPNVGKSTLMNLFAGEERSIVTDVMGTTRDIIEETVRVGDVVLKLSDTAGIRKTSDTVEEIGVKKATARVKTADLILAVFDSSTKLSEEDYEIIELCRGRSAIAIINKIDLEDQNIQSDEIKSAFSQVIYASAASKTNTDDITNCINELFNTNSVNYQMGILCNERQRESIKSAKNSVTDAINAFNFGQNYDSVGIIIEESVNYLLELVGERATESVVDEIFSNFCVGK